MADLYYDYVTLLLHGNGTNGSTTITDSSGYARTVTANGVTIGTGQSKFGGASLHINATTSPATVPYSTDFDADSSDMTIEAWIYKTGSSDRCIVSQRNVGNINYHLFAGSVVSLDTIPSGGTVSLAGTTSITLNTWHHVAATKEGNTWRVFLDGNLEDTATISGTYTATTTALVIGASSNNYYFDGYIDDLRLTKGIARYTASFDVPTEEFANEAPPPGTGDAGLTLPMLVVEGSDITTAGSQLTLPGLTTSISGGGYVDANLPGITAVAIGGASASATIPKITVAATRGEGVALSLPAIASMAYSGGASASSLPGIAAVASGHDATGERDAQIPLPSLTAAAVGGHYARATIPSLSAAATGTVPWIATSAATLPALTATVDARSSAVARAEPLLPALTAQGYSGAVCSVTVGALTLAASGTTGVAGAVTATLPLFVAVATGTIGNTASADITLPSLSMATGVRAPISLPSLNLVAIGTATVAVTYEAYALNLKHTSDKTNDELTRYTNFPFDRIVRYKDSYYGMNATGLYLLEGTTDDGDPIPWEVETHITDFGNPKIKTVERAYFGGRLGPDATVTLSVGEQADNSYSYTTPRGQTVQNYRQVFGKGAKARYFSVGVAGEDEIELDSLELAVTELARRI